MKDRLPQEKDGNRHESSPPWRFRLYVVGKSLRSVLALSNLNRICEKHLKGKCSIEVIDLLEDPTLATEEQIVAVPTVIRFQPEPARRVVGDLSDEEATLTGLEIYKRSGPPFGAL